MSLCTWHSPNHTSTFRVGAHPPHMGPEEEVGAEEDAAVLRDRIDHLENVAAGAAVVQLGLHLGGRIHVADDHVAGKLRLPGPHIVSGDRRRERAARREIGEEHPLGRCQDRGRLRHEVHAAEDDHFGVGRSRRPGEAERVAHEVGNILDFGALVVVRQHDRLAARGERPDLPLQPGDIRRAQRGRLDDRQSQRHPTGVPLTGASGG